MYLRFDYSLDFLKLAQRLSPGATEESCERDYENVYEWMYIDLPQLDFSLNISRAHGWADIDDEIFDRYEGDQERLNQLLRPAPVYVMGWKRGTEDGYVDDLPEWLAAFFANRLNTDVLIFNGRLNVDGPDGESAFVIKPRVQD